MGGAGNGEKAEVLCWFPAASSIWRLRAGTADGRMMISSCCRWFIGHPGTRPTSNTSGNRFHMDPKASAGAWEPQEAGSGWVKEYWFSQPRSSWCQIHQIFLPLLPSEALVYFSISIFRAAASTAIFAFKLLQYTPCLIFTGILHLHLFWVSCIPFPLTSSSKGVPHLLAGHSHFLSNSKAALWPGPLATYCLHNCVRLGAPAL